MFSCSWLRNGRRALRCLRCADRRGFAAPASGSFTYQAGEAAGVKFASRDLSGPTTTLALVSRAGTRYQLLPGLAEGLAQFAFRNTLKRSALRIVRETEILGSELIAYHSRENLVVGARFLREDLPYFMELLAEVIAETNYQKHVYVEEVMPVLKLAQKKFLGDTAAMALSSAHGLAFHRGLGEPLFPSSSSPVAKYVDAETIAAYASAAYTKPNFAIVANGAEHAEATKWVGEFFAPIRTQPVEGVPVIQSQKTNYHGGEERIAHASGNSMVIAFSGSSSTTGSSYKPEINVLAALLGGESNIKWSAGFSLLSKALSAYPGVHAKTQSVSYSDAGLLCTQITGSPLGVAFAAQNVVEILHAIASGEIAKEDFAKARAYAKFKELEWAENINNGVELTGSGLVAGGKAYQVDETAKLIDAVDEGKVRAAAKSVLESRASVSAVGDLHLLPYAEEIGLNA